MSSGAINISMQEMLGKGYAEFWNSKKRYVVCKGSRASKKSVTAAYKIMVRMMEMPLANTLVIRKTGSTLKDSCWAKLQWAAEMLKVSHLWHFTKNPLEATYIPTGQKILFRGLDEPLKLTSITVSKGYLCFAWLEEAYEIDEQSFNTVDESLRGVMPEGYYIQWLIIFNPWDSSSWLKRRFFDEPHPNVLAMTTTYKCNEWLSKDDLEKFEDMRKTDPERYKVAGLAEWGVAAGRYFKQWDSSVHIVEPFQIPQGWTRFRSCDWGSARPYAVLWFAIDYDNNMYCYRELYGWGGKPNVGTGETAKEVGQRIAKLEKATENVRYGVLDSACWARTGVTGPTIAEEMNNVLAKNKLVTFGKCSKGRIEMANAFKQRLIGNKQKDGSFKPAIYFFSTCVHTIRTIPQLAHDEHNPETYDTKGEDHIADTIGYACLSRPWTPTKPAKDKEIDGWRENEYRKPSAWST